jgi:3-hydroxyacyl-CoA dehydrogenase/3a,7a,12a-trihydroxy-5b-cholest-24-enoyl-CoA hydratase
MPIPQLRYDGQVAVVTGAGGGLGRIYSLLLASRGCKVVVNDLGTGVKGSEGTSSAPADQVVAEIKKAGGQAVANYDSVENGDKIVKTAIDTFGRIDILINNAGILRDVGFGRMSDQEWDIITAVHLKGVYKCTRAAWDHMRTQKYGRIVMTTSPAGLYGNVGQANYSAAKLGQVGFANTLAKEGKKLNIKVNTIAPIANSRMTQTVMPKEVLEVMKPESIATMVCFLCHESCPESGSIFELAAGWYSKVRWQRSPGVGLNPNGTTLEELAENFSKITDFSGDVSFPTAPNDAFGPIMENVNDEKWAKARL